MLLSSVPIAMVGVFVNLLSKLCVNILLVVKDCSSRDPRINYPVPVSNPEITELLGQFAKAVIARKRKSVSLIILN